tara:strand:+ start:1337 stop:1525 length:189 start_codon:yes stop_codon:yes gene_type:complete
VRNAIVSLTFSFKKTHLIDEDKKKNKKKTKKNKKKTKTFFYNYYWRKNRHFKRKIDFFFYQI